MKNIILLVIIFVSSFLQCQTFTNINAGLTGVAEGSVKWGDYDNDGDLDILLTGSYTDDITYKITKIYNNDSGVFSDINAGLIGVENAFVDWGDYDNDGDLDILIAGFYNTIIYRNDSGIFIDINAGLTGVVSGSGVWGDYDNDGDLDIFLTGYIGSLKTISTIYRNDSGTFTDIEAGLTGILDCSSAWGDYDNDGDLDILLSGLSYDIGKISRIYRNDSGTFIDIEAGLTGVFESSVDWGDYDSDGDLDILLTGAIENFPDYNAISKIYRNDTGVFTDINANLTSVHSGSSVWGDYDNDGDLDVLLTGSADTGKISKIYRNDSGIFTDIGADLSGISDASVEWGDYDNDGDLDFIAAGRGIYYGTYEAKIYRNNSTESNNIPSSPLNLSSLINGNEITFSWDKSTDTETLQNGLSYNMYIGTESQTPTELSPMSIISSGYRKVADLGNTGQNNSWAINNLPSGTYYWSVQAIDNAFSGSLFSPEQIFEYTSPSTDPPLALPASNLYYYSFQANWSSDNWAMGFFLDVATDSLFTNYVSGFQNKDVKDVYSYDITGLEHNTTYYYRIRSYNGDLTASENSNTIIVETLYSQFNKVSTFVIEDSYRSVEWGDYDNDGDLDLLLTNSDKYNYLNSKIYRNDSGVFTDINAGLQGVCNGSANWGDFDNDGDLDILLTGDKSPPLLFNPVSKIYRNDSGVFTDINAALIPVTNSSVSWGDYDNDGDIDILLTGRYYYYEEDYIIVSKIYRNNSGVFTDIDAGLTGITGIGDWADYDNDGDLDVILCGYNGSERVSIIYRNDSGVFTDNNAGLSGVSSSSIAWGDYDNDGDLDLLITGATGSDPDYDPVAVIYRNDSGMFTDVDAGLTGVFSGSANWGDYDNDGDLDVLLTGSDNDNNSISKVYRNDSGIFTQIDTAVKNINTGFAAWGDYDNDGDIDILLTGISYPELVTELYENTIFTINTIPNPPSNLSASFFENETTFHWDKTTDNETPQNGLSYNIYLGTVSQTTDKISPMSNITSGYRKVVNIGNTGQNNYWTINNLPAGTYYWSVQSIDNGYAGSEFSLEQTFVVTGIEENTLPFTTELFQNYPNPFNPETVIKYSLEKDSQVSLKVFDIAGKKVYSLVDQKQDKGYQKVAFNAKNLTSGIYFYQLKVNDKIIDCKKMMMIK